MNKKQSNLLVLGISLQIIIICLVLDSIELEQLPDETQDTNEHPLNIPDTTKIDTALYIPSLEHH